MKTIWQTKKWWEMLVKSWQAEKIFEINWIFLEKRKIALWEYWLFIIWINNSYFSYINKNKKEFINLCKKEKCLFLQIEFIDYKFYFSLDFWENLIKNFKYWYYKKFITQYTAVIDLSMTEESILYKMKQKWRYNIKLAEKKWVLVKEVEKTDENIKLFYNLMKETTQKKWFHWNTFEYYKIFLNQLDNSKLLLAYYDWIVISWWIFIFDTDLSIYYYWASTKDITYKNLMAPYLLQREAIKIAKNIWSNLYDFLWVAQNWDKNSSLVWVTDFKKKFTEDIRFVSYSYIYINKKIKYFFINILRKIKNS